MRPATRSHIRALRWTLMIATTAFVVAALAPALALAQDDDLAPMESGAGAPHESDLIAMDSVEQGPFDGLDFPGEDAFTHSFLTSVQIIYLPDAILDGFFDRHGSHWDGRSNLAFGLDYILRSVNSWELRVSVQWSNLGMRSQYWLEADKDADAADFTRQNLSVVALDTAFYANWDLIPEVGIFLGGGLWGGAVFGKLEKANILQDCADEVTAGERSLQSCPTDGVYEEETAIPPFIGLASLSTGARFQLDDRVVVRLEGGYKGWFFGNLSIGGQFW